ncbi:TIGR03620 family F420-dependent LLM class oxidoreductase [Nocardia brasiliensis]|uniref:TIGR03620 family F420-dependent LLM class oxidoreductase n=1 Tax=Nocardia brasiliensis TaxID=37326 RepID=UPI0037B6F35E
MVHLGRYGVWSLFWRLTPTRARHIERLGYRALWLGGSPSDLIPVRVVLEATSNIVVGTSIVNIFQTDPKAIGDEFVRLSADFPDRVVLGLGIGHQERLPARKVKPLSLMNEYLDVLDQCGVSADRRFIAALGPKMLRLSAERAAGTLPYLAPAANTRNARALVDTSTLIVAEHKVVLEPDLDLARAQARATVGGYFSAPNYVANLRRYGYTDADFADNGSDRLIDAVVATGAAETIVDELDKHLDAGADHVAIQVIEPDADAWHTEMKMYLTEGRVPAVIEKTPDYLLDTLAQLSATIHERQADSGDARTAPATAYQ